MKNHDELQQRVSRQIDRMQKAEKDRPTLLAQTAYLGMLGLLLVVPVVVGAYLGRWLDGLVEGYSMRWTLSLIIVGVVAGAFNVYRFIKE
ncbi:MAG: AtpZ/AtpI family protein [Nitrospira sp.]|nr:AtpZ/AtpI family protein [Nitrospira sp.]